MVRGDHGRRRTLDGQEGHGVPWSLEDLESLSCFLLVDLKIKDPDRTRVFIDVGSHDVT